MMLTGCSVQISWNRNLFHNTLPVSKYITANTNYHCATNVVIKAFECLLLYWLQHYFSMLSPKKSFHYPKRWLESLSSLGCCENMLIFQNYTLWLHFNCSQSRPANKTKISCLPDEKRKKKKGESPAKVTRSSGHTRQGWLWKPMDLLGQHRVLVGAAEDEVNIECTGWHAGHTTKTPTDFSVAKISLFRASKCSSRYLHLWIYRINAQNETGHWETLKCIFFLEGELYKNKESESVHKNRITVQCKMWAEVMGARKNDL